MYYMVSFTTHMGCHESFQYDWRVCVHTHINIHTHTHASNLIHSPILGVSPRWYTHTHVPNKVKVFPTLWVCVSSSMYSHQSMHSVIHFQSSSDRPTGCPVVPHCPLSHTHTHTHIHWWPCIYIYVCMLFEIRLLWHTSAIVFYIYFPTLCLVVTHSSRVSFPSTHTQCCVCMCVTHYCCCCLTQQHTVSHTHTHTHTSTHSSTARSVSTLVSPQMQLCSTHTYTHTVCIYMYWQQSYLAVYICVFSLFVVLFQPWRSENTRQRNSMSWGVCFCSPAGSLCVSRATNNVCAGRRSHTRFAHVWSCFQTP